MTKFNYQDAHHAHIRIDQVEQDMIKLGKTMENFAKYQQSTSKGIASIKWSVIGGLSYYIVDSIGIVQFLIKVL